MKQIYILLLILISATASFACNTEEISKSMKFSDYKDAERRLNQCLLEHPDDPNLIKLAAELSLKMEKMDLFQKYCNQLMTAGNYDNSFQIKLSKILFQKSRYNEVKAIGDKILSTLTSSEKNDFYKYYGQSLRNTNYFLEAIQILEEYISSNPTDKEALMALSESYGEIENYEKADEILERALSDNIAEGMSQKQLGDAHYDAGRLIDAKSAYNNALVLGINTDLPFWMNMGYLHFDLKEYDQATLMCDSVLKISPYDLNALNLKAYSYFNAQKLKEARAIAEQILKIKKDDANTIYFIGMTYQKADQMGKAEKYFEKAIEINPALSKQRSEKFNWDGRTQ